MRIVAVVLGVALGGCTATFENEGPANLPVVGGQAEAGYPAVGLLLAGADAANLNPGCGATVIRADAAVTAAHCVVSSSAFGIRLGDGDDHVAREAITHPGYDPDGFERYRHDVAVILFDDELGVEPATIGGAEPGEAGRYIGYGRTTPGGQDVQDGYTFERKSTAQTIDRDDGQNIWTAGVDGGLCWGDSGGPLMIDGTSTILGVLADFDGVFDCHVGNRMIFTSLAAEDEFVEAAIEGRLAGVGEGGGDPGDGGWGDGGWGGGGWGGAGCDHDCATYGFGEGDCAEGWSCAGGCLIFDGCGLGGGGAGMACELACSDFGWAEGECGEGWYCDGVCLTFTGCWSDGGGAACEYSCADYGYAAGQCEEGWYCDGVCLTYAGCGFDEWGEGDGWGDGDDWGDDGDDWGDDGDGWDDDGE